MGEVSRASKTGQVSWPMQVVHAWGQYFQNSGIVNNWASSVIDRANSFLFFPSFSNNTPNFWQTQFFFNRPSSVVFEEIKCDHHNFQGLLFQIFVKIKFVIFIKSQMTELEWNSLFSTVFNSFSNCHDRLLKIMGFW